MSEPLTFHNIITKADRIATLLFRSRSEVLEAGLSQGQWFQSSSDGHYVQLWETMPPDLRHHLGEHTMVSQWLADDVLCVLTEEEFDALWDGGGMRTIFEAGAMIRILLLSNGQRIQAGPDEFFQTDRSHSLVQQWKLKVDAPPVRPRYWYSVPSEHVELVDQWSIGDVRLTLSEGILRHAREYQLLRTVLGEY